jgi:hypothetical protein
LRRVDGESLWQDEAGLDASHLCLDLAPGGEGSVLRHVLHVYAIRLHITNISVMYTADVQYGSNVIKNTVGLERVPDSDLHYFGKLNPDSH